VSPANIPLDPLRSLTFAATSGSIKPKPIKTLAALQALPKEPLFVVNIGGDHRDHFRLATLSRDTCLPVGDKSERDVVAFDHRDILMLPTII